jgi:hypothetical protein
MSSSERQLIEAAERPIATTRRSRPEYRIEIAPEYVDALLLSANILEAGGAEGGVGQLPPAASRMAPSFWIFAIVGKRGALHDPGRPFATCQGYKYGLRLN